MRVALNLETRWRRWNAEILKARLRRDALMVEASQDPSESLEPDRRRRPSSSLSHSNCIFKQAVEVEERRIVKKQR